jgi:transposase
MNNTAVIMAFLALLMLGITGVACLGRPDRRENVRPADTGTHIDLNTADVPMLMLLPGIGRSAAERIITARSAKYGGLFHSVADLHRLHTVPHESGGVMDHGRSLPERVLTDLTPFVICGQAAPGGRRNEQHVAGAVSIP